MGQAENAKDRCLFRLSEKAAICSRFLLEQQSRKPRAIAVPPNAAGGCRFSHHWRHYISAWSNVSKGNNQMPQGIR
jgi:hypothetical protein